MKAKELNLNFSIIRIVYGMIGLSIKSSKKYKITNKKQIDSKKGDKIENKFETDTTI